MRMKTKTFKISDKEFVLQYRPFDLQVENFKINVGLVWFAYNKLTDDGCIEVNRVPIDSTKIEEMNRVRQEIESLDYFLTWF